MDGLYFKLAWFLICWVPFESAKVINLSTFVVSVPSIETCWGIISAVPLKSTLPIFLVFCNAVAVAELPLQELALPLILPVTSPVRSPITFALIKAGVNVVHHDLN